MDDQQKIEPAKIFGKKKQLETEKESLSQEIYKRNIELAETNRTLEILQKIDNLVLDSKDEINTLSQNITGTIISLPNYTLVGLMANMPHTDCFQLLGLELAGGRQLNIEKRLVQVDVHDKWVVSPDRTLTLDLALHSNDEIAKLLHTTASTLETLKQTIPFKTLVISKLVSRYRIVGLLLFGFAKTPDELSAKEMPLIKRLSESVGIALDNKLLFDENQRVLLQLQQTNVKLRQLDQTKDEFISLASHQLRTPLTSVKGYLSMVLEGDTGQVPEMQKKLLTQAYVSSQRMVYLIADLLNISRLKTGKFVIEPVPANLAQVVDDEVNQLKETAKSKNLTLIYNKPENFPTLMFDETKIRQVIMNFMDNAIYYSKPEGKIVVEVKETDKTVEYTVTDSGIGVKKEDQPHLFGKFYRAGNAKKARPDGTGLGLFMAKKIIVAQGGIILFKSQEGVGSTFGFSFEKEKMKMPEKTEQPPAQPVTNVV